MLRQINMDGQKRWNWPAMNEDLLDDRLRIIKPLLPANDWVDSRLSKGDYLIRIDWKLENDPRRQNIATIHPTMVSTVCLFLLFWSFRLYCLELQALLPPSPFAVQFLCPFACVLAHDISFVGFSCFIGWSNNKQQPLSWSMSIMPCFCRCLLPDSIRLLPGLRRVCPTLY